MKNFRFIFLIVIFSSICPTGFAAERVVPLPSAPASIAVYFSPDGGCTRAVVGAIDEARTSILVQCYSFTSRSIAKALIAAHDRGVDVEVIADAEAVKEHGAMVHSLEKAGVPTYLDAQHQVAHNKVMVIDGRVVVTGSFNFTYAAEKYNAENVLIIRDSILAKRYADNWRAHLAHSQAQTQVGRRAA